MNVVDAIRSRRSVREFTDAKVEAEVIGRLLELAVYAPNHHMTQPWRFYVLGEMARREFGKVLGGRKAKKVEDPAAARAVIEKITNSHGALPGMVAFAMVVDENPEKSEENYASLMMALQNFALAATAEGLATHIKTGAVMQDPGARAAVGVGDNEKIVAMVELGEPANVPVPKERRAAAEFTTWRD